jgi:hypothetical protein
MKRTGPQCWSCRRGGGKELLVNDVVIIICDECRTSQFRIARCVERAKEAQS